MKLPYGRSLFSIAAMAAITLMFLTGNPTIFPAAASATGAMNSVMTDAFKGRPPIYTAEAYTSIALTDALSPAHQATDTQNPIVQPVSMTTSAHTSPTPGTRASSARDLRQGRTPAYMAAAHPIFATDHNGARIWRTGAKSDAFAAEHPKLDAKVHAAKESAKAAKNRLKARKASKHRVSHGFTRVPILLAT